MCGCVQCVCMCVHTCARVYTHNPASCADVAAHTHRPHPQLPYRLASFYQAGSRIPLTPVALLAPPPSLVSASQPLFLLRPLLSPERGPVACSPVLLFRLHFSFYSFLKFRSPHPKAPYPLHPSLVHMGRSFAEQGSLGDEVGASTI